MNLLIGYDGSECADAALRELKRAGLPSEARSVVLTIADVWPPPPPGAEDNMSDLDQRIRARVLELREGDKRVLVEAGNKAAQAARIIQASFPNWNVRSISRLARLGHTQRSRRMACGPHCSRIAWYVGHRATVHR